MLLFSIFIGGSFSFGKLIAHDVDPIALTSMRFLLAVVVIGVTLAISRKFRRADYRKPFRFFILGGLFGVYFVLMFYALRLTTSLSLSVIFTMMPFLAALIDRVFFGRVSPASIWGALIIGAIGALWVVFEGSLDALISLDIGLGEIMFFSGVFAHAAYAVLIPRLRLGEDIAATGFGVMLSATAVLLVAFWPRVIATDWMGLSKLTWIILIYLAIMSTVLTFALIAFAASRLPSAKVTAYTYLAPFWVVVLDSIIGQSVPAFMVLAGGVPITLALILLFIEKS